MRKRTSQCVASMAVPSRRWRARRCQGDTAEGNEAAPDTSAIASGSSDPGAQQWRVDAANCRAVELLPGFVHLPKLLPPETQQRLLDLACRVTAAPAAPTSGGWFRRDAEGNLQLNDGTKARFWDTIESRFTTDFAAFGSLVASAAAEFPALRKPCQDFVPRVGALNYYRHGGRMNWHADDSNFARLDRPIVMACLGAAASFGYKLDSKHPDREVRLESGDVIVFGGPARNLVHALLRVFPGTAPRELRFPPDLAGGRVSVTWRDVGPEDGLVFNSDERLGLVPSPHALPRYRKKLCNAGAEQAAEQGRMGYVATRQFQARMDSAGNDWLGAQLGIGTWAWGSEKWGFGCWGQYDKETLREAFRSGVQKGIRLFDCAEVYGRGMAEEMLGQFSSELAPEERASLLLASKWHPKNNGMSFASARGSQTKTKVSCVDSMFHTCRQTLRRMRVESLGLMQLHSCAGPFRLEEYADALAEVHKAGLAQRVGICNCSLAQMRRVAERLQQHNVALSSVQVEFSLLCPNALTNGLLEECKKQNVTLLAYSPLGMGRLCGGYSSEKPPRFEADGAGNRYHGDVPWAQVSQVVTALQDMGSSYGKTPGQVALNWLIQLGAVPIPGAKTPAQAAENAGALGWNLAASDVEALTELSKSLFVAANNASTAVPKSAGGGGCSACAQCGRQQRGWHAPDKKYYCESCWRLWGA